MEAIKEFIQRADAATDTIFQGGIFTTLLVWAIIAVAAPLLLHLLKRATAAVKLKHPQRHVPLVVHLLRALIYIFTALGIVLQIIPLKSTLISLLATSGVIAVVIGLASQQAGAGLISGAFISIFKPFVIGDRINIASANLIGYVEDITLYHTMIRNLQNNRVVIPNALMNGYVIENVSKQENYTCNFLEVSVAYSTDLPTAIETLRNLCESHPDCIDRHEETGEEHKVEVRVIELEDSGIRLRAYVWSPDAAKGFNQMCDLRRDLVPTFDAAGIEIPFPCRNVYLRQGGKKDA